MPPSTNALIQAIAQHDLQKVQELLAAGVSPYAPNEQGVSPVHAWTKSIDTKNPDAVRMAVALFATLPQSIAENAELAAATRTMSTRVVSAVAASGEAVAVGVDEGFAYEYASELPCRKMQDCWSLVQHAYTRQFHESPTLSVEDYATAVAAGRQVGRQFLTRGSSSPTPIDRSHPAIDVASIAHRIREKVNGAHVAVCPRGDFASPAQDGGDGYFMSGAAVVRHADHPASILRFVASANPEDPTELDFDIPAQATQRLSSREKMLEALRGGQWEEADRLRQKHHININHLAASDHHFADYASLWEAKDAEQTRRLLALGADPWQVSHARGPSEIFDPAGSLPIQHARTQEQFDVLMEHMRATRPGASFTPETGEAMEFWKQSPHYEQSLSPLERIAHRIGNGLERLIEQRRSAALQGAEPKESAPRPR